MSNTHDGNPLDNFRVFHYDGMTGVVSNVDMLPGTQLTAQTQAKLDRLRQLFRPVTRRLLSLSTKKGNFSSAI